MFATKKTLLSLTLATFCISSFVLARRSTAKTTPKKPATATAQTNTKPSEFVQSKETPMETVATASAPQRRKRRTKNSVLAEKKSARGYKPLGQSFKDMSYDELKKQKVVHVEKNNLDLAAKYIEKMIPLCANVDERKALQFELADTLFAMDQLERASIYYKEFATLYPSDAKTEEAEYKAVRCAFLRTREADRDQSATKEAIALVDKFLEREIYTTYAQEAQKIRTACYEKLIEHEVGIYDFYLKQNDFVAAQKRLESITKEYTPVMPQIKADLLALEHKLAVAANNPQRAIEIMTKLTTEYPNTPATTVAQGKQKKNAGMRF